MTPVLQKYMQLRKRLRFAAVLSLSVLFLALPVRPAQAQFCELQFSVNNNFSDMANDIKDYMRDLLDQEKNFIQNKLGVTARVEVMERLKELGKNIPQGMTELWNEHFAPSLIATAKQLSFARVEQTLLIGRMMDAEMLNEVRTVKQNYLYESHLRHTPGVTACQVQTLGTAATNMTEQSRMLAASFTREDTQRGMNAKGSKGYAGREVDGSIAWQEYKEYFCDPAMGDLGCDTPGRLAGQHRDVAALLWGNRQSIDFSHPDMRRLRAAVTRYLILPETDEPVKNLGTTRGERELVARRARQTRLNTVYNALNQLLAERGGGSAVSTQALRGKAGIPLEEASDSASYRELQHTLMRDRFRDPAYIDRLVARPEVIAREHGAINALRMQQMNDLYKRLEEMVFMEAASFAAVMDDDLDRGGPPVRR